MALGLKMWLCGLGPSASMSWPGWPEAPTLRTWRRWDAGWLSRRRRHGVCSALALVASSHCPGEETSMQWKSEASSMAPQALGTVSSLSCGIGLECQVAVRSPSSSWSPTALWPAPPTLPVWAAWPIRAVAGASTVPPVTCVRAGPTVRMTGAASPCWCWCLPSVHSVRSIVTAMPAPRTPFVSGIRAPTAKVTQPAAGEAGAEVL